MEQENAASQLTKPNGDGMLSTERIAFGHDSESNPKTRKSKMNTPANFKIEDTINFWYHGRERRVVVDTIEPKYSAVLCRTPNGYKRFKVAEMQTVSVVK